MISTIILVFVLLISFGFYLVNSKKSEKNSAPPVITDKSNNLQPTGEATTSPTTVPTSVTSDLIVNWKIYTNARYAYSIKYPPNLQAEEQTTYSTLFNVSPISPGVPGFPVYWVSIIPKDFNDQAEVYNRFSKDILPDLFTMKIGDTIQTTKGLNPPYSDYWTYKRLQDATIEDYVGLAYENNKVWEGGIDLKDRRILIKKDALIYMIGSYYKTQEDLNNFQTFLSSFKFTN